MKLLACPFCREIFPRGEAATCPECGVELLPMDQLPLSLEAQEESRGSSEAQEPPEHRLLPWDYLGRGRGALLGLSLLGLATFCAPWVAMQRPELALLSGLDLATHRAPWLWGGAVGWFVQLPLVWTRRTVARLRGVRVVCAFFSGLTLVEVLMLVLLTRAPAGALTVRFEWAWGLVASALVSLVATIVAVRLGGRIEPAESGPVETADPDATLH